jgi:predicted permease
MYQWLLWLLPRHRRAAYGAEMATVFASVCRRAKVERGWLGVCLAWLKEIVGIVRFALRERLPVGNGRWKRWPGGSAGAELQWAWRNVRARGWSAFTICGILALALTANVVVFSVTDAVVFHREPFPDAGRMVTFRNGAAQRPGGDPSIPRTSWDQLAVMSSAVESLAVYNDSMIFVTGKQTAERVRAVNATYGLFEVLGVRPEWGRGFVRTDADDPAVDAVVISSALARRLFGEPAHAVGKIVPSADLPLRVVGVMPADFRFPRGSIEIWRCMDLKGPVAATVFATFPIARLRHNQTIESTAEFLRTTLSHVRRDDSREAYWPAPVAYVYPVTLSVQFIALLGAAACLLLTACANVAGIEMATVMSRSRSLAIRRALGASRWQLARGALLEGGLLIGGAAAAAVGVSLLALRALEAALPDRYAIQPVNRIDLDERALLFMIGLSVATWVVTTFPVVLLSSGHNLSDLMKGLSATQAGSPAGTRGRRMLTVAQVALTVVLLVTGLLYTRTYLSKVNVEKGFDSTHLVAVSVSLPPQAFGRMASIRERVLTRLSQHPAVESVMSAPAPQNSNSPSSMTSLSVDGTDRESAEFQLGSKEVPWNYHDVLKIPITSGRTFQPSEPENHVIVNEQFANRFWPAGAVGHSFRSRYSKEPLVVVGVARHVRVQSVRAGDNENLFLYYTPAQPPAAPIARPGANRPRVTRGVSTTAYQTFTGRLTGSSQLKDVVAAVKEVVPDFPVTAEFVDDQYAEWEAAALLQTQIVTVFGVLAFLTALAGVYGTMRFIVIGRTREIGVRMALGARPADIAVLILGSAGRLTLLGAVLGMAGAYVAARYVEAELFGVSVTDPLTYAGVGVVVCVGSLIATALPMRNASGVDAVTTLRAD